MIEALFSCFNSQCVSILCFSLFYIVLCLQELISFANLLDLKIYDFVFLTPILPKVGLFFCNFQSLCNLLMPFKVHFLVYSHLG